MRIGVTGSAGFIGSFFSRELCRFQPHPIRVLVRRSGSLAEDHPLLEVCAGDLTSKRDCDRFVAGLDVIYHLAHCNSPVNSDRDLSADTLQNLIPTQNLIEAMVRADRRIHLVYFSSGGAIYSSFLGCRAPFRESDPPRPTSSYGIQKLAVEHYLRLAAERGQISATVLRIGNAFGTLLPQHRLQGFVGVSAAAAIEGRPIRIFGNPNNIRDWVHLSDISSLAWIARAPHQPYDIVNVGSGRGHSVEDIVSLLRQCGRREIEVERHPNLGLNLIDWIVLDVSKAKLEYGWEPQINLADGIRQLFSVAS